MNPTKSPENKRGYGHAPDLLVTTAADLVFQAWRNRLAQVETAIDLGERAVQAVTSGSVPPDRAEEFLDRITDIIAGNPHLPPGFRTITFRELINQSKPSKK